MPLRKKFHLEEGQLGKGAAAVSLRPNGQGLVVVGGNGKGMVLGADGSAVYQFSLHRVKGVGWDSASELIAFISENGSTLATCNPALKKMSTIDIGATDMCFMRWSQNAPLLAVGTLKGGVTIYNRDTQKKIPVLGVHSGRIIDGQWLSSKKLATVAVDCILSLCAEDGTLLLQASLPAEPITIAVVEPSSLSKPENTNTHILILMKNRTALFCVESKSVVDEIIFDESLGAATCITGINSSSFVACVGFKTGAIAVYSLSKQNWGKNLSLVKPFSDAVKDVAFCEKNNRYACIGDNHLKIFNATNNTLVEPPADVCTLPVAHSMTNKVMWDRLGQFVVVSATSGDVMSFSTAAPLVRCPAKNGVLYLMGERDVGYYNVLNNDVVMRVEVPMEPTLLAAGEGRIAAANGNIVCYFSYMTANDSPMSRGNRQKSGSIAGDTNASSPHANEMNSPLVGSPKTGSNEQSVRDYTYTLIDQVEYSGAVQAVKVNGTHAAVLAGGQITVQLIGVGADKQAREKVPAEPDPTIHSMNLSEHFLTYATKNKICVVVISNMHAVVDYAVPKGVKAAFPSSIATRIAFIDGQDTFFILNPVTATVTQVEGYETNMKLVMWDETDNTVLVTTSATDATTFSYVANSRHGATCESVLQHGNNRENLHTPIPSGYVPVSVFRGNILCQTPSGTVSVVPLLSHQDIYSQPPSAQGFFNSFSLNHLHQAMLHMSSQKQANDLCIRALHLLDVELALRVYSHMSEPAVVLCLEKIKHIHEKNLLIGHICMILRYFKDAENAFLRSSQPICALEMRRDLMQWEHALSLARNIAPDQIPQISKDYARQLEYRGDYVKALQMYKMGVFPAATGNTSVVRQNRIKQHNELCNAGAARCMLRTGSIKEGVKLAMESKDKALLSECAKILETQRNFEEAAQLYEATGNIETAATLYIVECRNLKAAGRLLPNIKSRNILVLYAKGKEEEKEYADAEKAYAQAEDWDNVVRIKAENLDDLHGAYVVVRRTRSAESAALVARMCRKKGENSAAVEFLVLAKQVEEAFRLARQTDSMQSLESALLSQVVLKDGIAPPDSQPDFSMVANYYDGLGKPGLAGQFYHIAGNFNMALSKYLEAGQPEDIDKAVQVVGMARSDALTNRLVDYLIGESDGEPKDTSYIFKLYMALGSYEKAAKTSVLIASKEQEIGNYRVAHHTLVEACRMLQSRNMHISSDLRRALMLLHSYMIVKHLIKPMQDEATAARMLLRVVRNIVKFPQHISTILSSTVLQCLKAGFNKSAFENARLIVQSEKYRTDLTEKQRKRIEGVVRHRGNEELTDPPEPKTPCPECGAPVPETDLDCGACKNSLPFCIVTGKHMVNSDSSVCPHCKFPALYSAFTKYLVEIPRCPMCDEPVNPNEVTLVEETERPHVNNKPALK